MRVQYSDLWQLSPFGPASTICLLQHSISATADRPADLFVVAGLQGSIDWMYYSRVYLEIGIPLIVDQSVTGDQLTGGSVCSWGTRPEGNAVFTSFIFWSSSLSFVCTVWVYFFVRSRLWTCFSSCYHLLVFNCFMTFILLCTEFWHLYDMCSGNLLDVHCVDNIPVQVYRNHTCTVMDI